MPPESDRNFDTAAYVLHEHLTITNVCSIMRTMETLVEREYTHSGKRYVPVTVCYHRDGSLSPLSFGWEGREYTVDRILDHHREASLIAGATGIRYICRVLGRQLSLWDEGDRWFVELRFNTGEGRREANRRAEEARTADREGLGYSF